MSKRVYQVLRNKYHHTYIFLSVRGVYVGGTSAGGHLTACVMATHWPEFPDADPTLLKGNRNDQHTQVAS